MTKIPFLENEMQIIKTKMYFGQEVAMYDTPVSPLENMMRTLNNEPLWQIADRDYTYLYPLCMPDNKAKGNVSDVKLPPEELGGIDMFGIEWEYQADIGGSTVHPGKPLLANANEWKEKVKFPTEEEIRNWTWGESKERMAKALEDECFGEVVICTGWFERLISFMDFVEAACALIDPSQKDAVKELFDRLSDLYIFIIDHFVEVFGDKVHCVCLHDDWGQQRGQLISVDTAREMILPYMKKVIDHLHAIGLKAEVHSCGKVEPFVPVFIEAGFELLECQKILDFDEVVPKYGDKIKVHMPPENVPAEDAPDEAFRQCAREYVDRVVALGNPVILDTYYPGYLAPAFYEELYRYSRIRFSENAAE